MNTLLLTLFWFCFVLVFYTYIGYGLLLWLMVRVKRILGPNRNLSPESENTPEVTLVIAAYNEEDVVEEKMRNCQELIYPKGKLHICWVTDGSNDSTNERLSAYEHCRVLYKPERQGKTAAINRAVPLIDTPIVAFTDANTMLNPEAIAEMAKLFLDPKVGCVAGEKRIRQQEKGDATAGEGLYWKYESFLKSLDDELHTAVGAAGELYAIRRELFETMPNDTLLDDFIVSMRIASKGYKIAYCKTAFALEAPSSDIREEEKRKVRIAAGGLQSIYRLSYLLNPFRYGILHFQYVSHRVLRWSLTPLAFFLMFPLTIALLVADVEPSWLYATILLLQLLFYGAGMLGFSLAKKKIRQRGLYIPYYFLFMNINVLRGYSYLKKRSGSGVWEKAKRAK